MDDRNLSRIYLADRFKQIVLAAGLFYWFCLVVDLVFHPLVAGPNIGGPLFRWLSALIGTLTVATGLFIMRKVQGNSVGFLLFLWGVGATGWSLRSDWENLQLGILMTAIFALYFFCIACPAIILMIFYFPDGKIFPRSLDKWQPALIFLLVFFGLFYPMSVQRTNTGNLSSQTNLMFVPALNGIGVTIYVVSFVVAMFAGLIVLVSRYLAGSEVLRKQVRWLVSFLFVAILVTLGMDPLQHYFSNPFANLMITIFGFIFLQGFPAVSIGFAILMNRLWDIDVIIRRTLVYAALSVCLGLVYFGGVTFLQGLAVSLAGQQSPAATVISTLIIAALFSPLRRRIQDFIDRRFYRQKYDADQALADFASAARSEVELNTLENSLVGVVDRTLKPNKIFLWVKEK